jgi:hypothetical protein
VVAYVLFVGTGAEGEAGNAESAPALLSVYTVPSGAEVILNDQSIGRSPISAIRLGPNETTAAVRIRLDGFVPIDTVLRAGDVHELFLKDAPTNPRETDSQPTSAARETGIREAARPRPDPVEITVSVVPPDGVTIAIDAGPGRLPGRVELLPGSHAISVQSERWGRFEDRISVTPGGHATIECYFERNVRISSGTTWATVLDNRQPVLRADGTPETTPVELSIGPGEHHISLLKHGFEARLVGGAPGPITITPSCEPAEPYTLVFELRPK